MTSVGATKSAICMPEGEIHLALVRHQDGRRVLGGVADDRHDDHPHEHLADPERGPRRIDRADKELAD